MESTPASLITFPFMDLPLDLRKEVYDCYARVLSIDDDNEDERNAVTKTRTSLLVVSHQVRAEWWPTFMRTTSIIVHGPRSAYIANAGYYILTGRSLSFDKIFVKLVSTSTLNNIRRLCYDASIHGPFGSVTYRKATTVNFQNLRQFAHILSRLSPDLLSLQTVELYGRWWAYVRWNQVLSGGSAHRRPSEEAVWALARNGGQWEEIEDLLVHRKRRAALKGWEISRNVEVAAQLDVNGVYLHGRIFSVHVLFSKNGTDAGRGEATDPKVTVHFRPFKELERVFVEKYRK